MKIRSLASSLVPFSMLACLGAAACGGVDVDHAPVEPPAAVAEASSELMGVATDTLIPIRIVVMSDVCTPSATTACIPCSAAATGETGLTCKPYTVGGLSASDTFRLIQQRIETANEVFKPARVQFYVRSFEHHQMPAFRRVLKYQGEKKSYSELGPQLRRALPAPASWSSLHPSTGTEADGDQLTVLDWLYAAGAYYSSPEEMTMWLTTEERGPGKGTPPAKGRATVIDRSFFTDWSSNVAHEFGHYLGLPHSGDTQVSKTGDNHAEAWLGTDNPDLVDPRTNAPVDSVAVFWDLIYGKTATGEYVTFQSEADARAFAATPGNTIATKDVEWPTTQWPEGGNENSFKTNSYLVPDRSMIKFHLGTTGFYFDTSTRPDLGYGLAFKRSGKYTGNVMTYDTGVAQDAPAQMLSGSQIAFIRANLRYDVANTHLDSRHYPTGKGAPWGGRPLLGRAPSRPITMDLDLDKDGLRDLVLWEPPNSASPVGAVSNASATFRVRFSRSNYAAASEVSCTLGRAGDVPFVFDADGDGVMDPVVFSGGGGLAGDQPQDAEAYWRSLTGAYDTVTKTWSCGGSPTVFSNLGQRGDVPLGAYQLSTASSKPELVVYRPSTSTFYWREDTSTGTTIHATQVGDPAKSPSPMVQRVGDDGLYDFVVYEGQTGKFVVATSDGGFGASTTYDASLAAGGYPHTPGHGTSTGSRGVSVPVPDMFVKRPLTYRGDARRYRPALFHAGLGLGFDNWTLGGTNSFNCAMGLGDDATRAVPLGGIDRDGDGYSDWAFFVPGSIAPNYAKLVFQNNPGGLCTSTHTVRTMGIINADAMVFPSADVTGDGKTDVWTVDRDSMIWRLWSSDTDYANLHTFGGAYWFAFGTNRAVLLLA